MKKLLPLIVLLLGCEPPRSPDPLHPDTHKVREAVNIEATRTNCEFLGVVRARGRYGQELMEIRSLSADLGGNIFIIVYDSGDSEYGWRSLQAEAYLCPPAVLENPSIRSGSIGRS